MPDVVVSIVSFKGKAFVQRCLDSVLSQTYPAKEVHLLDNASEDGTPDFVSRHFPAVKVISSRVNLGFGAGHNRIIRQTHSAFVLVLNQDAFLSSTFLEELVRAMSQWPNVGIAGGKLFSLREAESNIQAGDIIDITWLDIEKKRRQVCYAHGQPDTRRPSAPTLAFAIDGAAMLLRRSMLTDIEMENEFFDEDFFAGKEDLDISWRAQLLGWKCLYVPTAVGYHVRTFTSKDRRSDISESLKVNSIRNRYLLMLKNDVVCNLLRHLPYIVLYEAKIIGYVVLYERSSLRAYQEVLRLLPKVLRKRRSIMRRKRVGNDYILSWFR